MLLNKLVMIQILNILSTKSAIIGKKSFTSQTSSKAMETGTFYLNSERPLWVLQDIKDEKLYVKKPNREKVKCEQRVRSLNYHSDQERSTDNKIHTHFKGKNEKRSSNKRIYKGLQLPQNYIPVKKASRSNTAGSSRRYKNSKFIQDMPVFDAVPGEETYTKSTPIFIYAGNKGRMLLNTMLSKRKYPMQEPVPGQVLYPPPALVFKPKVLVENLQQKLNVTMIPFYSYEAIDPRVQNQQTTTDSSSMATSFKPVKKRKTAKQYTAFYSPHEVLAQPITDQYHYQYQSDRTTSYPLTLKEPYANHRPNNISFPTTTPSPHKKFEVKYNDGEDKFQITYEDAASHLERPLNAPTTTQAPVPYESYTFDKNYYAFPVYTMAKLFEKDVKFRRPQEETVTNAENSAVERQQIEKYIDVAMKEENDSLLNKSNEDTWFILNSRYKGPLKTNTHNLHSSKYIQTSPVKLENEMTKSLVLKPTKTKTTKVPLQPQMRSLYGEDVKIIL